MEVLQLLILIIYGVSFFFIFLYSVIQLHLVILYVFKKVKPDLQTTPFELPMVTIQLPVYNEMYVIERLINAVAAFDYPKDKFEIHILDDSDDETVMIVADKVKALKKQGFLIEQIIRKTRTGYKAGALEEGLKIAKGDLIAIFDADFIPSPDFLKKTVPVFRDQKIGMVQTKWGHINKNYSLLTRLQAFGLDAHFTIEQSGRNKGGYFINFNGTAGIWRKKCIIEGGGWHHNTLTEDLDLSYRTQMKNWKFKYLEDVQSPAELPTTLHALKLQQFRWTKGGAETAKKILPKVMFSNLNFSIKLHSIFHLMNSTVFISIITTAILSIPVMLIKVYSSEYELFFNLAPVLMLSLLFLSSFYWTAIYREKENIVSTCVFFIMYFPLFLSISMGLSLHNSIAVAEGYIGYKSPFMRTPKFRIEQSGDKWINKKYFSSKITFLTILELCITIYFIIGIYLGIILEEYGFLPFHAMLVFGFGLIVFYTVKQSIRI